MIDWTIDRICELTTSPTMLNALHACRPGHPLGKDTIYPWRNAWCLAGQHREIPLSAFVWLGSKASDEATYQTWSES
jgi:hypothetical protein